MPRNMSFALTKEQVRNRTKTETRRLGWWFLCHRSSVPLNACEKCQGIQKGGLVVIDKIRTLSSEIVRLGDITQEQVEAEGFPGMTPEEFVDFFIRHMPRHRVWLDESVERESNQECEVRSLFLVSPFHYVCKVSEQGQWVTQETTPNTLVNRIRFAYGWES